MRVFAIYMLILVAVLLMTPDTSTAGGLIPGIRTVPAGIDLYIGRLGSSDTIRVRVAAGFDPAYGRSGEWELVIPPGMSRLSGRTEAHGAKRDVEGAHDLYLRCERWGDFELLATMTAMQDSLNYVRNDYRAALHVTADSFTVRNHPTPYGFVLRQYVIDGVHYRWHGVWWLPLDPGETEETALGFDSSANIHSAPVIHVETAAHIGSAPSDSSITVPVWVAVDRSGHVKDARLVNPNRERGISQATKAAALVAAWKWRFAPAYSLGRPVSTLYVIKVPVAARADQ